MSHLQLTDGDGFRLVATDTPAARPDFPPTAIVVACHDPDGRGIGVDLTPVDAGQLGDLLTQWAVRHGRRPAPATQAIRWNLPHADVLAVLVERVLTGEDPTVVGLERYAAAYGEAHRIASALPEVLGLLEELNPIVDAEVMEETGDSGWQTAADLAEALRLTAEWSQAIALPGWSWFDALNRYNARLGFDAIPATGRPAGVSAMSRREFDDAVHEGLTGEKRPSVRMAPMPTVRDLGLVLDWIEEAERSAITWDGQVSDATRRLRASFDAAIATRADFLDQLDGRPDPLGRDGDPVEDEDGAPLPESVQALITSAGRVTAAVNDDTVPALLRAVDGLAVSLARVVMESRR